MFSWEKVTNIHLEPIRIHLVTPQVNHYPVQFKSIAQLHQSHLFGPASDTVRTVSGPWDPDFGCGRKNVPSRIFCQPRFAQY